MPRPDAAHERLTVGSNALLGSMKLSLATSRIGCLAAVTVLLSGCAESSFVLAPDSRLPAWFEVPPGHTRSEVTVTMDYYVFPTGREAKFKLRDSRGRQLIAKSGASKGLAPLTSRGSPYPAYEIITVDGVTDVIEHRKMEPVFYVTDDPIVRRELGVK